MNYLKIALDTKTDRLRAEEYARIFYKQIGLKYPNKVLWFEDPISAGKRAHKQSASHKWEEIKDRLLKSIKADVENLRVSDQRIRSQLQITSTIRRRFQNKAMNTKSALAGSLFCEAGCWFNKIRASNPKLQSQAWEEINKTCGGFWPYKEALIFCDKPIILETETPEDETSVRLHCETGPAIKLGEFEYFYIHGVEVPKSVVVDPTSLTTEQIKKEKNTEVKRIMIERIGWISYLNKIGSKILDRRENEIEGTTEVLVEAEKRRYLVCGYQAKQGTTKIYALEVPSPDFSGNRKIASSCEEAQMFLSSGLASRTISAS
jgi:hypothetical protein